MSQYEKDRERLQLYLPMLRGCAGLSAEALAIKVGLTKQAISYLENHLEKKMTKMQYICIRSVFDEEYNKNPENVNLRDCYDLVFSDAKFFEENKERIEYALYQAVEDTKKQRKIDRQEKKKKQGKNQKMEALVAGATAATIAIGGIAAATFPVFSPIRAAGAVLAINAIQKKQKKKDLRASSNVEHPKWMKDAFEAIQENDETES